MQHIKKLYNRIVFGVLVVFGCACVSVFASDVAIEMSPYTRTQLIKKGRQLARYLERKTSLRAQRSVEMFYMANNLARSDKDYYEIYQAVVQLLLACDTEAFAVPNERSGKIEDLSKFILVNKKSNMYCVFGNRAADMQEFRYGKCNLLDYRDCVIACPWGLDFRQKGIEYQSVRLKLSIRNGFGKLRLAEALQDCVEEEEREETEECEESQDGKSAEETAVEEDIEEEQEEYEEGKQTSNQSTISWDDKEQSDIDSEGKPLTSFTVTEGAAPSSILIPATQNFQIFPPPYHVPRINNKLPPPYPHPPVYHQRGDVQQQVAQAGVPLFFCSNSVLVAAAQEFGMSKYCIYPYLAKLFSRIETEAQFFLADFGYLVVQIDDLNIIFDNSKYPVSCPCHTQGVFDRIVDISTTPPVVQKIAVSVEFDKSTQRPLIRLTHNMYAFLYEQACRNSRNYELCRCQGIRQ